MSTHTSADRTGSAGHSFEEPVWVGDELVLQGQDGLRSLRISSDSLRLLDSLALPPFDHRVLEQAVLFGDL